MHVVIISTSCSLRSSVVDYQAVNAIKSNIDCFIAALKLKAQV
jgi:hypothetical protein